jgi:hypothetical protein
MRAVLIACGVAAAVITLVTLYEHRDWAVGWNDSR